MFILEYVILVRLEDSGTGFHDSSFTFSAIRRHIQ